MKYLHKHIWILLLISFLASILLPFSMDINSVPNWSAIIGYPIEWFIKTLRQLSLSSTFGNVVAWILYLVVSLLPAVFGWFLIKKDQRNRFTSVLLSLMSIATLYFIYGLLNFWFVHPMFQTNLSAFMPVINFSIMILLVAMWITVWISYMFTHSSNRKTFISQFQVVLYVSSWLLIIQLGFGIFSILNQINLEVLNGLPLFIAITSLVPTGVMVILTVKIARLLEEMKSELFSVSLLKNLSSIRLWSKIVVLSSISVPLILGVVQMVWIHHLQDVNIQLNVPWTELLLSFTILFVSELLIQGIKTSEENKQFI